MVNGWGKYGTYTLWNFFQLKQKTGSIIYRKQWTDLESILNEVTKDEKDKSHILSHMWVWVCNIWTHTKWVQMELKYKTLERTWRESKISWQGGQGGQKDTGNVKEEESLGRLGVASRWEEGEPIKRYLIQKDRGGGPSTTTKWKSKPAPVSAEWWC